MLLRTLAALAFLLPASRASAQNNWYIKPAAGIGISNIQSKPFTLGNTTLPTKRDDLISYNGAINIGKRIGKLDLSTGVQYLTTGHKTDFLYQNLGSIVESGTYTTRYHHILIPIQVGYCIPLGKKLSFVPQLGVAFSYTARVTSHIKTNVRENHNGYAPAPGEGIHLFGVFGSGHLNIEYAINNLLSISLAPTGYYILTKFDDPPSNAVFDPKQHNYSYGIDAGVRINLRKGRAKEKPGAVIPSDKE